jgi:prepilin-type processing-associated H-X9-DG protein
MINSGNDGGTVNSIGFQSVPSSNHPGGVVASFCDGHTQLVNDTIDAWVYAQLMTSDSKWNGTAYYTNSSNVQQVLLLFPQPPYKLSEGDY